VAATVMPASRAAFNIDRLAAGEVTWYEGGLKKGGFYSSAE
jgi:hypothetical protein